MLLDSFWVYRALRREFKPRVMCRRARIIDRERCTIVLGLLRTMAANPITTGLYCI